MTPRLIRQNPAALAVYQQAMTAAWTAKNRLLALGVPLEHALYVLPNAKALRLIESGSFIALQHKWTLRTCFNAQEEIYLASMDEITQVAEIHPHLGRHLGPPCVLRNKIVSPRCTGRHAFLRRAGLETRSRTPNVVWWIAWVAHLYTASGAVVAPLAAPR
ncbi:MAG: FAD-dependent thymidylate synthase [Hymenobacter sp.]